MPRNRTRRPAIIISWPGKCTRARMCLARGFIIIRRERSIYPGRLGPYEISVGRADSAFRFI